MKKRGWLVSIALLGIVGSVLGSLLMFTNCESTPYANSTLGLSKKAVTINMDLAESMATGRVSVSNNVTTVKISSNNMPAGAPKKIFAETENKFIATCEVVNNNSIAITAVNSGKTRIRVVSGGGGIVEYIDVNVKIKAKDFQLKDGVNFAITTDRIRLGYSAKPVSYEFSQDNFDFFALSGISTHAEYNYTANDADIVYELYGDVKTFAHRERYSIKGNVLTVSPDAKTPGDTGYIEVAAKLMRGKDVTATEIFKVWVFDPFSDVQLSRDRYTYAQGFDETVAKMVLNDHANTTFQYVDNYTYNVKISSNNHPEDPMDYGFYVVNPFNRYVSVQYKNETTFQLVGKSVTEAVPSAYVEVVVYPIVKVMGANNKLQTIKFDGEANVNVQSRRRINIAVYNVFTPENELHLEGVPNASQAYDGEYTDPNVLTLFYGDESKNAVDFQVNHEKNNVETIHRHSLYHPTNNRVYLELGLKGQPNKRLPASFPAVPSAQDLLDAPTFPAAGLDVTGTITKPITDYFKITCNGVTVNLDRNTRSKATRSDVGYDYRGNWSMVLTDEALLAFGDVTALELRFVTVDQGFIVGRVELNLMRAATEIFMYNEDDQLTNKGPNTPYQLFPLTGAMVPNPEDNGKNTLFSMGKEFDFKLDASVFGEAGAVLTEREKLSAWSWEFVNDEHKKYFNVWQTSNNSSNPPNPYTEFKIQAKDIAVEAGKAYPIRFYYAKSLYITAEVMPIAKLTELSKMVAKFVNEGDTFVGKGGDQYEQEDTSGEQILNKVLSRTVLRVGGDYNFEIKGVPNSTPIWVTVEGYTPNDYYALLPNIDPYNFASRIQVLREGIFKIQIKFNSQNKWALPDDLRTGADVNTYFVEIVVVNPIETIRPSHNYFSVYSKNTLYMSSVNDEPTKSKKVFELEFGYYVQQPSMFAFENGWLARVPDENTLVRDNSLRLMQYTTMVEGVEKKSNGIPVLSDGIPVGMEYTVQGLKRSAEQPISFHIIQEIRYPELDSNGDPYPHHGEVIISLLNTITDQRPQNVYVEVNDAIAVEGIELDGIADTSDGRGNILNVNAGVQRSLSPNVLPEEVTPADAIDRRLGYSLEIWDKIYYDRTENVAEAEARTPAERREGQSKRIHIAKVPVQYNELGGVVQGGTASVYVTDIINHPELASLYAHYSTLFLPKIEYGVNSDGHDPDDIDPAKNLIMSIDNTGVVLTNTANIQYDEFMFTIFVWSLDSIRYRNDYFEEWIPCECDDECDCDQPESECGCAWDEDREEFGYIENGYKESITDPYTNRRVTVNIYDPDNHYYMVKDRAEFLRLFYTRADGVKIEPANATATEGANNTPVLYVGKDFSADTSGAATGYYRLTSNINFYGFKVTPIYGFAGTFVGTNAFAVGGRFMEMHFGIEGLTIDNTNVHYSSETATNGPDNVYHYGMFADLRGLVGDMKFSNVTINVVGEARGRVATAPNNINNPLPTYLRNAAMPNNSTVYMGVVASKMSNGAEVRDVTINLSSGYYELSKFERFNFGGITALNAVDARITEKSRITVTGRMFVDFLNVNTAEVEGAKATVYSINAGGLVGENYGFVGNPDMTAGASKIMETDINITCDLILGVVNNISQDNIAGTNYGASNSPDYVDRNVGGMIAKNNSGGVLANLSCENLVMNSMRGNTGGVVAWNNGRIRDCYTNTSIFGRGVIGGVVGYNAGQTENCLYDFFINTKLRALMDDAIFQYYLGRFEIGEIKDTFVGYYEDENGAPIYESPRTEERYVAAADDRFYAGIIVSGLGSNNAGATFAENSAYNSNGAPYWGDGARNNYYTGIKNFYGTGILGDAVGSTFDGLNEYPTIVGGITGVNDGGTIDNVSTTSSFFEYDSGRLGAHALPAIDVIQDLPYVGDIYLHKAKNVVVGGMIGYNKGGDIINTMSQLVVGANGLKSYKRVANYNDSLNSNDNYAYGDALIGGGIGYNGMDVTVNGTPPQPQTIDYLGAWWNLIYMDVSPDTLATPNQPEFFNIMDWHSGQGVAWWNDNGWTNNTGNNHINTRGPAKIGNSVNNVQNLFMMRALQKPEQINFQFRESKSGYEYGKRTVGYDEIYNVKENDRGGLNYVIPASTNYQSRLDVIFNQFVAGSSTVNGVWFEGQEQTNVNKFIGYRNYYTPSAALFYTAPNASRGGGNYEIANRYYLDEIFQENMIVNEFEVAEGTAGAKWREPIGSPGDLNYVPGTYIQEFTIYPIVHTIPINSSGRVGYRLGNESGVASFGTDNFSGKPRPYVQLLGEGSFDLYAYSTRAISTKDKLATGRVRFDVVPSMTAQTVVPQGPNYGSVAYQSLLKFPTTNEQENNFAIRKNMDFWVQGQVDALPSKNGNWEIQEKRATNRAVNSTDVAQPEQGLVSRYAPNTEFIEYQFVPKITRTERIQYDSLLESPTLGGSAISVGDMRIYMYDRDPDPNINDFYLFADGNQMRYIKDPRYFGVPQYAAGANGANSAADPRYTIPEEVITFAIGYEFEKNVRTEVTNVGFGTVTSWTYGSTKAPRPFPGTEGDEFTNPLRQLADNSNTFQFRYASDMYQNVEGVRYYLGGYVDYLRSLDGGPALVLESDTDTAKANGVWQDSEGRWRVGINVALDPCLEQVIEYYAEQYSFLEKNQTYTYYADELTTTVRAYFYNGASELELYQRSNTIDPSGATVFSGYFTSDMTSIVAEKIDGTIGERATGFLDLITFKYEPEGGSVLGGEVINWDKESINWSPAYNGQGGDYTQSATKIEAKGYINANEKWQYSFRVVASMFPQNPLYYAERRWEYQLYMSIDIRTDYVDNYYTYNESNTAVTDKIFQNGAKGKLHVLETEYEGHIGTGDILNLFLPLAESCEVNILPADISAVTINHYAKTDTRGLAQYGINLIEVNTAGQIPDANIYADTAWDEPGGLLTLKLTPAFANIEEIVLRSNIVKTNDAIYRVVFEQYVRVTDYLGDGGTAAGSLGYVRRDSNTTNTSNGGGTKLPVSKVSNVGQPSMRYGFDGMFYFYTSIERERIVGTNENVSTLPVGEVFDITIEFRVGANKWYTNNINNANNTTVFYHPNISDGMLKLGIIERNGAYFDYDGSDRRGIQAIGTKYNFRTYASGDNVSIRPNLNSNPTDTDLQDTLRVTFWDGETPMFPYYVFDAETNENNQYQHQFNNLLVGSFTGGWELDLTAQKLYDIMYAKGLTNIRDEINNLVGKKIAIDITYESVEKDGRLNMGTKRLELDIVLFKIQSISLYNLMDTTINIKVNNPQALRMMINPIPYNLDINGTQSNTLVSAIADGIRNTETLINIGDNEEVRWRGFNTAGAGFELNIGYDSQSKFYNLYSGLDFRMARDGVVNGAKNYYKYIVGTRDVYSTNKLLVEFYYGYDFATSTPVIAKRYDQSTPYFIEQYFTVRVAPRDGTDAGTGSGITDPWVVNPAYKWPPEIKWIPNPADPSKPFPNPNYPWPPEDPWIQSPYDPNAKWPNPNYPWDPTQPWIPNPNDPNRPFPNPHYPWPPDLPWIYNPYDPANPWIPNPNYPWDPNDPYLNNPAYPEPPWIFDPSNPLNPWIKNPLFPWDEDHPWIYNPNNPAQPWFPNPLYPWPPDQPWIPNPFNPSGPPFPNPNYPGNGQGGPGNGGINNPNTVPPGGGGNKTTLPPIGSTPDFPIPIYTPEDLENIGGGKYYVLPGDIELDNWKPKELEPGTKIDGNGNALIIKSLDLSQYPTNIGVWSEIADGCVITNLNIVIPGNSNLTGEGSAVRPVVDRLYVDEDKDTDEQKAKIDYNTEGTGNDLMLDLTRYPEDVREINVGVLAGRNFGVVSNVAILPETQLAYARASSGSVVTFETNPDMLRIAYGVNERVPSMKGYKQDSEGKWYKDEYEGGYDEDGNGIGALLGRTYYTNDNADDMLESINPNYSPKYDTQATRMERDTKLGIWASYGRMTVKVHNPNLDIKVGGMVGVNEGGQAKENPTGVISNSRVYIDIFVTNKLAQSQMNDTVNAPINVRRAVVAGFAALNRGSIVSSSFRNASIINNCRSAEESQGATSSGQGVFTTGFVGFNVMMGYIKACFAETGDYKVMNQAAVTAEPSTPKDYRSGSIISMQFDTAGFIFTNGVEAKDKAWSIIEDCYVNVQMRRGRVRSGFAFYNEEFGIIRTSIMDNPESNMTDMTASSGKEQYIVRNSGTCDNNRFVSYPSQMNSGDIASNGTIRWAPMNTVVSGQAVAPTDPSYFDGFSIGYFEKKSGSRSHMYENNIWQMRNDDNAKGPRLVSAADVKVSIRHLNETATAQYGEPIYVYHADYAIGTAINPYLIYDGNYFNNLIYENSGAMAAYERMKTNNGNADMRMDYRTISFSKNMRIINNISLNRKTLTRNNGLVTYMSSFNNALLDGNGLEIRDIALNASDALDPTAMHADGPLNSVGLFRELVGAVVKNVKMSFVRLSEDSPGSVMAQAAIYAGGLAGKADAAEIVDIEYTGMAISGAPEKWRAHIIGGNISGGLVGYAKDTRIEQTRGSISVQAYRGRAVEVMLIPNKSTPQLNFNRTEGIDGNYIDAGHNYVSIAGGVVGFFTGARAGYNSQENASYSYQYSNLPNALVAADDYQNATMKDVSSKTSESYTVMGEVVGGIIGVIDRNTTVKRVSNRYGATLVTKYYAGGISGLNYGTIDNRSFGKLTAEYAARDLNKTTTAGTIRIQPYAADDPNASTGGNGWVVSYYGQHYKGITVGSIAGFLGVTGTVNGAIARGSISGQTNYLYCAGGIVGQTGQYEQRSTMEIDGVETVVGEPGGIGGRIENSTVAMGIGLSSGFFVGGIVGRVEGIVEMPRTGTNQIQSNVPSTVSARYKNTYSVTYGNIGYTLTINEVQDELFTGFTQWSYNGISTAPLPQFPGDNTPFVAQIDTLGNGNVVQQMFPFSMGAVTNVFSTPNDGNAFTDLTDGVTTNRYTNSYVGNMFFATRVHPYDRTIFSSNRALQTTVSLQTRSARPEASIDFKKEQLRSYKNNVYSGLPEGKYRVNVFGITGLYQSMQFLFEANTIKYHDNTCTQTTNHGLHNPSCAIVTVTVPNGDNTLPDYYIPIFEEWIGHSIQVTRIDEQMVNPQNNNTFTLTESISQEINIPARPIIQSIIVHNPTTLANQDAYISGLQDGAMRWKWNASQTGGIADGTWYKVGGGESSEGYRVPGDKTWSSGEWQLSTDPQTNDKSNPFLTAWNHKMVIDVQLNATTSAFQGIISTYTVNEFVGTASYIPGTDSVTVIENNTTDKVPVSFSNFATTAYHNLQPTDTTVRWVSYSFWEVTVTGQATDQDRGTSTDGINGGAGITVTKAATQPLALEHPNAKLWGTSTWLMGSLGGTAGSPSALDITAQDNWYGKTIGVFIDSDGVYYNDGLIMWIILKDRVKITTGTVTSYSYEVTNNNGDGESTETITEYTIHLAALAGGYERSTDKVTWTTSTEHMAMGEVYQTASIYARAKATSTTYAGLVAKLTLNNSGGLTITQESG